MTDEPEGQPPDEPHSQHGADGGRKLDEDAVWAQIVENYGERVPLDAAPEVAPVEEPPGEPAPRFTVFDRRWEDPQDTPASWDDEGHFVPPEPPPLPVLEPRRKAAWAAMFGAPLALLVGVLLGLVYPTWLVGLFVMGFIGGFVYLVATMAHRTPDDGSGDNGAVL